MTRPGAIKLFMLNSTEPEIYRAHNVKIPTIVGILTFIGMTNTTSDSLKARIIYIFQQFNFDELLKVHTQLS